MIKEFNINGEVYCYRHSAYLREQAILDENQWTLEGLAAACLQSGFKANGEKKKFSTSEVEDLLESSDELVAQVAEDLKAIIAERRQNEMMVDLIKSQGSAVLKKKLEAQLANEEASETD